MKSLQFIGSSQQDLAKFPEAAKRQAGFELWQVQLGLMPSDFKPMPTVGPGAHEVRIKVGTQWRVFYVASRGDAVYVLHAFQKKSKTGISTPQPDVDLIKQRYQAAQELAQHDPGNRI